jgi:DNA-binding FrmR family transcriptional regulator
MSRISTELQQDIDKRLQRLEGQVRGIRRMINEGRDCQDVLTQLAAVRGAAYQISVLLVENYALDCVSNHAGADSAEESIAKLVNVLSRLA